jgi:ABC-2 type transport system permease protein
MKKRGKQIVTTLRHAWQVMSEEFDGIFSDGGALLLVGFATMIYTIIYSMAYGGEVVRDIPIVVVDEDRSSASRSLIQGLDDGPDTRVAYEAENIGVARDLFYRGEVFAIIVIPNNYELDLLANNPVEVALILDGSHLLLYNHVLEQAVSDILTTGAVIEAGRIIAGGGSDIEAEATISPITMNMEMLFNPYLGYGAFVMPSILIVIIQQTMLIGIALVTLYLARRRIGRRPINPITTVISKILVYIVIYGVNLLVILGVVWPIFDLPYFANTLDVIILLLIYMIAASALGLSLSHLFSRREAPIMLLLWSSIPTLLLAGISCPHEAFPGWMYAIGRILPSSSAVDAFIQVCTMGAALSDIEGEIITLVALAILYMMSAIICESRYCSRKIT